VPLRLRPTAPVAADAILVGDPGRALLLAQELLEQPKMSNHARGLWGYFGQTAGGRPLTVQSTGIGGPSAALVLADLHELGVRRAVRIGTCVGFEESLPPGTLVLVGEAIAEGGSAAALGLTPGAAVAPDPRLTASLRAALGADGVERAIASVDAHPGELAPRAPVSAGDMQTAPLLARAVALGVRAAAVLIVVEAKAGGKLGEEELEQAERTAGTAARTALST
jgi:uridine phosphorylase